MNAPADALQLELDGVVTGADVGDLLAVVSTLRAAAQAMQAGPGLRARRGAVLAAAHGPNVAVHRASQPWLRRRLTAAGAAMLLVLALAGAAAAAAGIARLLEGDSPAATEQPAPTGAPLVAPADDDQRPAVPALPASPDAIRPDDEEGDDHEGDDHEEGEDTDAPEPDDGGETSAGADESPHPHED